MHVHGSELTSHHLSRQDSDTHTNTHYLLKISSIHHSVPHTIQQALKIQHGKKNPSILNTKHEIVSEKVRNEKKSCFT